MAGLLDIALLAALNNPIPAARIESSAAQSIPNASTTQVTFNTVAFDTTGGAMGDMINDQILIPMTGIWSITGYLRYASASSTSERGAWIGVNGSSTRLASSNSGLSGGQEINVSTTYRLSKGDYVALWTWQGTGAALNTDTGFGWTNLTAVFDGFG